MTSPALCDTHLHPRSQLAGPPLEITQEAGEMVFVPSGWHHQVHNLVMCCSPALYQGLSCRKTAAPPTHSPSQSGAGMGWLMGEADPFTRWCH